MFSNIKPYQTSLLILVPSIVFIFVAYGQSTTPLKPQASTHILNQNDSPVNISISKESALYHAKLDSAKHAELDKRLKIEKEKDLAVIKNQRISLAVGTFSLIIICVGLVIMEQIYRQVKAKNKVIQAQNQLLENSNKVKDTIFAIISHDLRHPLSQIIDLLDLWEEGDMATGEIEALLPSFKVSSLNKLELLDNLLIWSKNQLQDFNFYPVQFPIGKTADSVINKLRPAIAQKNLSVINEIPSSISVFADEEMITITLRNLLSNAVKFTSEKGRIRLTGFLQNGFAIIGVTDTGAGIKTEDQLRIFSPHSTLSDPKQKNPGLGLKICKDFMAINNGRIWVESTPNDGSKFFISIPLEKNLQDSAVMASEDVLS